MQDATNDAGRSRSLQNISLILAMERIRSREVGPSISRIIKAQAFKVSQ